MKNNSDKILEEVFWNYLELEESNEKLSFESILFITFESNPINDVIFSRPSKKKLMRIQRSLFIGTEDWNFTDVYELGSL